MAIVSEYVNDKKWKYTFTNNRINNLDKADIDGSSSILTLVTSSTTIGKAIYIVKCKQGTCGDAELILKVYIAGSNSVRLTGHATQNCGDCPKKVGRIGKTPKQRKRKR